MPRLQRASSILALAFLLLTPLAAQSPRPMSIVDLLSIPRLADPRLSPDGSAVVYTKSDADWKSGKRISHIWRVRTDAATAPLQLTNGSDGENDPRWSPDGRTIAFTAKRGDDEFAQIYLLPADGGEARRLTAHASAVSELTWAPDGSAVYFSAPEAKTPEEKARDKNKDDVYAYDENFKHTHLWKAGVSTQYENKISFGDFSITAYELSADGTKIGVHRAPTPLLGSGADSEVWVMNADGSSPVQLTRNGVQETRASLSPDGSQVLFLSQANAKFDNYYNGRLFVAPAGGGGTRVVVGETESYDVDQAFWAADGKTIYFLANLGVHEELMAVEAGGGKPWQLTDGKHNVGAASRSRDRIVFTIGDATSGGEIWKIGRASCRESVKVDRANVAL